MRRLKYESVKERFPIVFALISQFIALFFIFKVFSIFFPAGQPSRFIFGQAGLSFFISQYIFRLPRWWGWIAVLLPILIVISLSIGLGNSWLFLVLFIVLGMTFSNTLLDRVPLYLTNNQTHRALSEICDRLNVKNFVDLGCGWGGVVRNLAAEGRRSVGVENAPTSWFTSFLLSKMSGKGIIIRENIWNFNLRDFDCIYVFLSPVPMERIYKKFLKEAPKGSYLISNSFPVPKVKVFEIFELNDERKTTLYIYKS